MCVYHSSAHRVPSTVIMSEIQRLLHKVNAPIVKAEDMRRLITLLNEQKHLDEFMQFFDSLKGKKTKVSRRGKMSKHAEAIREAMFELKFFHQHCCYGQSNKEFNFSTPDSNLNKLITYPFGDDAETVWKSLFGCVKDKRAVERAVEGAVEKHQPAEIVDLTGDKSEAKKELDPFFGPDESKADPGTCGFRNLMNSCYLNAVLQCLAHLDLMRQAFVDNFEHYQLNL